MSIEPKTVLLQGAEMLKPLFSKHGFYFTPLSGGSSSGGQFAHGEFRRADRAFDFHFRYSLGMITYHLGPESISHQEYMCSMLGKPGLSHYPGFSNRPLDAFRDLRDDLQSYCDEFLAGTNEAFLRRIENARSCWANRPKLPE